MKRIQPRQKKKGDRNLQNTLQGSGGQDSKGEAVCEVVVVGAGVKGVWQCLTFSYFGSLAWM